MSTLRAKWLTHGGFHTRTFLEMITPVQSTQRKRESCVTWSLTVRDEHEVH
jgi:hypothetical protein